MLDDSPIRKDVAAFVTYLQHERCLAINSQHAYRRDLGHFADWIESGGVADYLNPGPDDLGSYPAYLRSLGLASPSISRHVYSLKAFYKFLHLEERTKNVRAEMLEGPSIWERIPKRLSPAQAVKLLDAPQPSDRFYLRDRAILEVLYATGGRVSELCGLTLSALELDSGRCRLRGKGGKERLALLNPRAVAALRDYLANSRDTIGRWRLNTFPTQPSQWPKHIPKDGLPAVFLSQKGKAIGRIQVFYLIRKYGRRVRIDPASLHPHAIRHSFATHMLTGGADIRVVQTLLGHASINTTQLYTRVDTPRMRAVHKSCHPRG
jgi:integrase/recombinase XerD